MESKLLAERAYVWISNICLFGVVAIAIAYDRVSMPEAAKTGLFWAAMGLGVVSFASYAVRRSRLACEARSEKSAEVSAATASSNVAVGPAQQDQLTARNKEADSPNSTRLVSISGSVRLSKQIHGALLLDEIELLEEMERSFSAKQRYTVTIRALEQNEPVKLQELRELVYLRKASFEVLAGGAALGKVRKNPSKFVRQPAHSPRTVDIVEGLLV
ncbi:hypothetical protein [Trinickia sp. EG282A]|uniref:hypothetical protein n=1 Tax=Trinickia sp. EG282A TaxID=3237013 RepID=UPI0034D21834